LAKQIVEAVRESAPEPLQPIIQSLICLALSSQLLTRYGQWIDFNDCIVQSVDVKEAVGDNFPERDRSSRTAGILLHVADN
jgi:hypothetical protein